MKFLSYPELKERGIPFSRPWLWRLEKEGRFPRRKYLGEKTICWDADEIDRWMKSRNVSTAPAFPARKKRGAA